MSQPAGGLSHEIADVFSETANGFTRRQPADFPKSQTTDVPVSQTMDSPTSQPTDFPTSQPTDFHEPAEQFSNREPVDSPTSQQASGFLTDSLTS
jgi:hypothetical protein